MRTCPKRNSTSHSLRVVRKLNTFTPYEVAWDNSMPRSLRIARQVLGHVVNSKLFYSGLIEYSNFI
ncbi:hypothetical protein [Leptospira interrogans]|uniref:hypothetical protein n=1 Tax=Leptospira interrogans TaxID=173 RepID=UPI00358F95E4